MTRSGGQWFNTLGASMKMRGMSSMELERMTGLNHSTILRVKQCKYAPSVEVAHAIAGAMRMTIEECFYGETSSAVEKWHVAKYPVSEGWQEGLPIGPRITGGS